MEDGIIRDPILECEVADIASDVSSFLNGKRYDEVVLERATLLLAEGRTDTFEKTKFDHVCRWIADTL